MRSGNLDKADQYQQHDGDHTQASHTVEPYAIEQTPQLPDRKGQPSSAAHIIPVIRSQAPDPRQEKAQRIKAEVIIPIIKVVPAKQRPVLIPIGFAIIALIVMICSLHRRIVLNNFSHTTFVAQS